MKKNLSVLIYISAMVVFITSYTLTNERIKTNKDFECLNTAISIKNSDYEFEISKEAREKFEKICGFNIDLSE